MAQSSRGKSSQTQSTRRVIRRDGRWRRPGSSDLPTGGELVIALVGPIGNDLEALTEALKTSLRSHNYDAEVIKLSKLLESFRTFRGLQDSVPFRTRTLRRMAAGTRLRMTLKRGDALAVLALTQIRRHREERRPRGTKDDELGTPPLNRMAYILDQLKHPDEVETLRHIYGDHFVLVAAASPRATRLNNVAKRIAEDTSGFSQEQLPEAEDLIRRDEFEDLEDVANQTVRKPARPAEQLRRREQVKRFGQNVRRAFPLADFFVDTSDRGRLEAEVDRFVELVFGNTQRTPTRHEHGMFHARASALRSSALSRQVGAAITTTDGDLVALGTNDVPKPGGGLYWPADPGDSREVTRERDSSDEVRELFVRQLVHRMEDLGWRPPSGFSPTSKELLGLAHDTRLGDLAEFGRAAHAEMAALLDSAKRGLSVRGCWLYTTTFPCHTCTRYLIAAGIRRVIYVEPYSKSMAADLHLDAIEVDPGEVYGSHVALTPFAGVAPPLYMTLFAMRPRKDGTGKRLVYDRATSSPRVATDPLASYRVGEEFYRAQLDEAIRKSRRLTRREDL